MYEEQIVRALEGGVLIGVATSALLLLQGRIAGISGIFGNAVRGTPGIWRWAFLAGLVTAGLAARLAGAAPSPTFRHDGFLNLALAGLLVGIGTRIGSGCTSGHGVCGLANLSPRSLVAVVTFMGTAAATVFVLRHVVGSS